MAGNAGAAKYKNGIASERLSKDEVKDNFQDLHPALDSHEAQIAADRCYFCYDAPCMTACPTAIDIPLFMRQISTGTPMAAAETIFSQNILGGMCARVCPTETLCEQVCVRETAEGKPVQIGLLQRYATDKAIQAGMHFRSRAAATGKKIAVVGAGPASLSCAHRLATFGHDVEIFESRSKPGGLNEFGIAAYKSTDNFAQGEVSYVTSIGGINIAYNKRMGEDISLNTLRSEFDAVFLGMGLGGVNALNLTGKSPSGVEDAVEFIANLRQAEDKSKISVGRRVIVIGGGMTAVDVAVQAKLLGAEEVTICYRRGQEQMNASPFEQELAAAKGVTIRHWLQPRKFEESDGVLNGITLEYTMSKNGKLVGVGETITLPADQVFSAIGQTLLSDELGDETVKLSKGRIDVDATGQTSLEGVWAGGDCTNQGEDLTVTAVAQGRDAAEFIHAKLNN